MVDLALSRPILAHIKASLMFFGIFSGQKCTYKCVLNYWEKIGFKLFLKKSLTKICREQYWNRRKKTIYFFRPKVKKALIRVCRKTRACYTGSCCEHRVRFQSDCKLRISAIKIDIVIHYCSWKSMHLIEHVQYVSNL